MRATFLQSALRGLHHRFWIVGVATVAVCAALAAQAAGHVVEARYLSDTRRATPLPPPRSPAPPEAAPAAAPDSRATATALVERNMFCADCVATADVPEPGGGPIASSLPLALIATTLGQEPWATVRDTATGAQGAYGVGDRIPHVGAVERIAGTWIDVRNDAANRVERVSLLAVVKAAEPGGAAAGTAGGAKPESASAYADRIRKIDDNTVEVDRALVRELVSGGGGTVKGVRITPVTKEGKLAGLRVITRPGTLASEVGLKTGDVIEAVDGRRIESAQQLIDMIAKLDDLSSVKFEGTRRGQPLNLELRLR